MKVVELFAGVGGFRLGLEKAGKRKFDVIWSNQFEPNAKRQYASEVYVREFGENGHSNEDIEEVVERDFDQIPIHDLMVGGFPCQDYSVAKARNHSHGIKGKKGVLWWSIYEILRRQGKKAPAYLMLENVDRLLVSPVGSRGRDFAILLSSLAGLGYLVEWRVLNAADYGMPQRRRRVFIMAYKKNSPIAKKLSKTSAEDWLTKSGVIQKAFKANGDATKKFEFELSDDLLALSDGTETFKNNKSQFLDSGILIGQKVFSMRLNPVFAGKRVSLGDVLLDHVEQSSVPNLPEFLISEDDLDKWSFLKGKKCVPKTSKSGHDYLYREGSVQFPDDPSKPSRTIITGEGGKSPSRHKHVVKLSKVGLRRLLPVELERLNMFPDNHTEGVPDSKRAFLMGNAVVVGVVERLGRALHKMHSA